MQGEVPAYPATEARGALYRREEDSWMDFFSFCVSCRLRAFQVLSPPLPFVPGRREGTPCVPAWLAQVHPLYLPAHDAMPLDPCLPPHLRFRSASPAGQVPLRSPHHHHPSHLPDVCCPGADLAVHRSACSAPQRIALNGSPSPTPTWASWATPPAPPHHHLSPTEVVAGRRPSVGCPVLRCPPVAVARCAPPELECAGAHTGRHAAFPFTAGS